jgi:hypothetical protein
MPLNINAGPNDNIKVYAQTHELTWEIDHLPPTTRVYLFINNIPMSDYASPYSGKYGDALITDESGYVAGLLLIPNTETYKFEAGQIRLSFVDNPTNISISRFIAESSFYVTGNSTFNTDQGFTKSTDAPEKLRSVVASSVALPPTSNNTDPDNTYAQDKFELLAQTFFVNPQEYPNGLFISSLDLFFARKDSILPVSVEMQSCDTEGIPISNSYIKNSYVCLYPDTVKVPDLQTDAGIFASIGPATAFNFRTPIYFAPGQYAFSVRTNSDKYELYTSTAGIRKFTDTLPDAEIIYRDEVTYVDKVSYVTVGTPTYVCTRPPTWNDSFQRFQTAHIEKYGIGINRPWNSDGDSATAKTNIDNEYLKAIVEYNAQCRTSVVADQTFLGVNAQPNSYNA